MKPSAFYRSELWRAALLAARILPGRLLEAATVAGACIYCMSHSARRRVVEENLLPAFQMDRKAARAGTRELFRQFGLKLADLWRYESGHPVPEITLPEKNWEAFNSAREQKRGVLLLTAHIGNWELGAPFLRKRGVNLQVITQAEPHARLTSLRERSRAQWGIDTLVIGENPFAFVEVIRRLQEGAVVALLVDRPPEASAVTIKLFGHQFPASIAAAELARATGCVLLPVVLPRARAGYAVQLLPEVQYDRSALGNREARANLTQEIMRHFEPVIRQHITQWFHFVPVWEPEPLI